MNLLLRIEKAIVRLNKVVMVLSLATMIILGFLQIILRNFFDSGFSWADIVVRSLVLWVGFTGAVIATSSGHHIAIGALLRFLPEGWKRRVHVVISLIVSVICIFLTIASVKFIGFEIESGAVLFGSVPLWVSELIIPMTFAFLAYQFFVHAFLEPKGLEEEGA